MPRFHALLLLLLACPLLALAQPVPGSPAAEREAVLAAVRPVAERLAHQPVKFKLDQFNIDPQWALLIGELIQPDGQRLDWSLPRKALDCNTSDDKLLMAVVHKVDGRWAVKDIDICDGEPPYWNPANIDKIGLPCDLLRGLQGIHEQSPLEECRALRRSKRR